MKVFFIATLLIALLLVEPFLAKERVALGFENNQKVSVSETFLRMLGELRYSLASYLWLKTEIYHHELGLTTVTSRIGTADPKKIGEILSICRLVTKLDPGFVKAYDIGSWRLAQGLGKFNQAIGFLKEGISHNPNNAGLYADMGMIYFFYMKDYRDAIPYLKKSTRLTQDKLQKELQMKMLGYADEKTGRFKDAYQTFKEISGLYPDDTAARHQMEILQKKLQP